MRTLFLNPPSFEGFDGGASSRWPASREIESYWYPVWLCYPGRHAAGQQGRGCAAAQDLDRADRRDGEGFRTAGAVHLHPGFHVDVKMAEMMKDSNPKLKVAFVGPPVTVEPEKTLRATKAIDFVVRREFDHQIVDYAKGKPLEELPGVSFRKNGSIVNNPEGAGHRESGRAALGDEGLQARSRRHALQRSVPAESVHLVLHVARLPGACARSACGRRRTPATAGGCARPTMSPTKCRYALEAVPAA